MPLRGRSLSARSRCTASRISAASCRSEESTRARRAGGSSAGSPASRRSRLGASCGASGGRGSVSRCISAAPGRSRLDRMIPSRKEPFAGGGASSRRRRIMCDAYRSGDGGANPAPGQNGYPGGYAGVSGPLSPFENGFVGGFGGGGFGGCGFTSCGGFGSRFRGRIRCRSFTLYSRVEWGTP